jgi:predicted membrane GTPase involved in stress response
MIFNTTTKRNHSKFESKKCIYKVDEKSYLYRLFVLKIFESKNKKNEEYKWFEKTKKKKKKKKKKNHGQENRQRGGVG